MALTTAGLNDMTGMFPGAGPASITQDLGQGVDNQGYIGIPLNSIRFTGSKNNQWTVASDGTVAAACADGDGVSAANDNTSATGSFRNFMRGIHETAYHYTTGSLTGTNAFTYWNETAGSFSVTNQTTLSRAYTTTLYYEIGDSTASKQDT